MNALMSRLSVLVIALAMGSSLTIGAQPASKKKPATTSSSALPTTKNFLGMTFVRLPAGTFTMGADDRQPGEMPRPTHQVTLTKPFYMQTTSVTQEQWKQVMGTEPWRSLRSNILEGDDYPVVYVSWNEIQDFILKLNLMNVGSYRLPSEAEWEYACRAGTKTKFSFGDNEAELERYAWYSMGSQQEMDYQWKERGLYPHKVATKKPNRWGLYDMHGNVAQACQDWYGPYPAEPVTDPIGPTLGTNRVIRGGGIFSTSLGCRSDYRVQIHPARKAEGMGFRLVMDVE